MLVQVVFVYMHIKAYMAFDMRRALGILMPIKNSHFNKTHLERGRHKYDNSSF